MANPKELLASPHDGYKQNLIDALKKTGIPYQVGRQIVVLEYSCIQPEYSQALERNYNTYHPLFAQGKWPDEGINYLRGPKRNKDGSIDPTIEQDIFFFGTDAEFDRFEREVYAAPNFIAITRNY